MLFLALACQGELFDYTLPGTKPGSGQPPTPFTPALALRIGGTGSDLVAGLLVDPDGGMILAGTFIGSADFDPGPEAGALTSLGGADGFIARYTPNGSLVWARRFGGDRDERVSALARDAAGNIYLGGGFEGSTAFEFAGIGLVLNSLGGEDGFVAKFSPGGSLLWARRFGGGGSDRVAALAVSPAGNAYAGGSFEGLASAFPAGGVAIVSNGSSDGFLLALGADGSVAATLPIGGPEADAVLGVAISAGGNPVAAGTFRGASDFARNGGVPGSLTALGGSDVFLARYSPAGLLLEIEAIGGLNDESVVPGGLTLDGQGGPVLIGGFSGSVDFDPGPGTAVRTRVGGGSGGQDLFLARYDDAGGFLSVATIGGLGAIAAASVIADPDGSALVTGAFSGPVDFDPGPGLRVLTSYGTRGATDAFAARYTAAGLLAWVGQFGSGTAAAEDANAGTGLGLDPAGNVIVTGRFFGTPDFDPGNTAFRLTSLGAADGFLVKLTSSGSLAP